MEYNTYESNTFESNTYKSANRQRLSPNRRLSGKRVWLGVLAILILISTTILYINNNSPVMLIINGEPVAVVTGEEQVDEVIGLVKSDLEKEHIVTLTQTNARIEYDRDAVDGNRTPLENQQLYALVKDKLEWQVDAWAISIDGVPTLFFGSQEDGEKALTGIKEYYLPQDKHLEMAIEQNTFAEEVLLEKAVCKLTDLKTPDDAVTAMVKGLDTIVTHTVINGDSLWTIAHVNNMTVSGLRELNSQLKSDLLKPGQIINLVKSEPLLNVVTTLTTKVEESIAYKTVYEKDENLWRGQQKVKQPGQKGTRVVEYRVTKQNDQEVARETLAETILKEPVTQIVYSGAKIMVASRGDGGSGILSWPMRGRLTSLYGNRRGGFHTGLDIDGVTGDPVYSAEAGVVLQAARDGNYGRCIVIDHGNGLSTRYAHLSAFNVSIGQTVKRGDLIGKCGNTGRSTGSHLHFEVRVNGAHRNPINYLN